MLKAYFKYRRNRVNAHGIHSPFVFFFYNEIIKRYKEGVNSEIEKLRKNLEKNKGNLTVLDLGAGSVKQESQNRKISEVTKVAAIPKKYGALLARVLEVYDLKTVLELGTSLGVGTGYLATATEDIQVTTIEGCPQTAAQAQLNFDQLKLNNIDLINQEFSEALAGLAAEKPIYDLIYIDGNHRYDSTLEYFKFALEHTHDASFIIFDDIYWSEEMTAAWNEIKKSEAIHVSMDLFRMGIVCKRKGQRKQDFILKF